jgi:HEPN domain-containing protein
MSDAADPMAWVEKGEEDYAIVRSSLRRKKPLLYGACFHSQQCAEKYLKALLVAKGLKVAKTHDLLLLSKQCEKAGILVAMEPKKLNDLSDYAVLTRYPGDIPTLEEARDALEIAKAVRRFARKLLNV